MTETEIKKYFKGVKTFPFVEEFSHHMTCLQDVERIDKTSQEYLEIKKFLESWKPDIADYLLCDVDTEIYHKFTVKIMVLWHRWFVKEKGAIPIILILEFRQKLAEVFQDGGIGHSFLIDEMDRRFGSHPVIPADKFREIYPAIHLQIALKLHKTQWYIDPVSRQQRWGN